MIVARKIKELRGEIAKARAKGKTIALVPTMGALHEGHMSLVAKAREKADFVVAYIFINPRQFGPSEDFSRYPRTEKEDLKKLERMADMAFIPGVREIYPEDFSIDMDVGEIGKTLEGKFRPGFLGGVATVLAKFFNIVQPDLAVFGEKDYQQLQVIKKLVRDLNMPVKIFAGKTVREKDGLALASRNIYLSKEERKIAPLLYKAMREAAEKIKSGEDIFGQLEEAKKKLIAGGFSKIDYLELVDAENLVPLTKLTGKARILAAAWLGKTRLIDNIQVS